MKNFKRSFFAVAFMLLTVAVQAGEPTKFSMRAEGEKSFALFLGDLTNESVWVRIVDSRGYLLFDEKVKNTDTFAKKYNMQNLPEGNYKVEVEGKLMVRSQSFSIIHDQLQIEPKGQQVIYKPVVSKNGAYLDLNYLNVRKGPVKITLLNDSGEVVFEEDHTGKISLHRRYDLTALKKGEYACVVKTGGKAYTEFFKVQ